jgi:hypothetical protein
MAALVAEAATYRSESSPTVGPLPVVCMAAP